MTDVYDHTLAEGEVQSPKPFHPELNRIVCSANRFSNGDIVVGVRHYDTPMHAIIRRLKDPVPVSNRFLEQGFLDRFGDFHTREEAWIIAHKAGQIIRRCGSDYKWRLYSENLY